MASISKVANGYRAQVYVGGRRASAVRRTKREAEAWGAQKEVELRAQQQESPASRVTLGEMLQRYADEVSVGKRGARWELLRIAAFKESTDLPISSPVGSVTPEQIAMWRDARLKQVQPGSVLRELGLLSAVFEHARKEWRLLPASPVRDVRRPSAPDHREVVITRKQIRIMLQQMGHRPKRRPDSVSQAVAVAMLLALRTGMRAGEICGLTWARVFPDHCLTPHKTGRTAESLRAVPLTPKARALIEQMRGWDDVLVFGVGAQTLDALFRKYRKRAGLSGFTFHDTRHTAATWLAQRLDVLDLCKMFGWRDTKQALTYYNPTAGDIARRITGQPVRGQSR